MLLLLTCRLELAAGRFATIGCCPMPHPRQGRQVLGVFSPIISTAPVCFDSNHYATGVLIGWSCRSLSFQLRVDSFRLASYRWRCPVLILLKCGETILSSLQNCHIISSLENSASCVLHALVPQRPSQVILMFLLLCPMQPSACLYDPLSYDSAAVGCWKILWCRGVGSAGLLVLARSQHEADGRQCF